MGGGPPLPGDGVVVEGVGVEEGADAAGRRIHLSWNGDSLENDQEVHVHVDVNKTRKTQQRLLVGVLNPPAGG